MSESARSVASGRQFQQAAAATTVTSPLLLNATDKSGNIDIAEWVPQSRVTFLKKVG